MDEIGIDLNHVIKNRISIIIWSFLLSWMHSQYKQINFPSLYNIFEFLKQELMRTNIALLKTLKAETGNRTLFLSFPHVNQLLENWKQKGNQHVYKRKRQHMNQQEVIKDYSFPLFCNVQTEKPTMSCINTT